MIAVQYHFKFQAWSQVSSWNNAKVTSTHIFTAINFGVFFILHDKNFNVITDVFISIEHLGPDVYFRWSRDWDRVQVQGRGWEMSVYQERCESLHQQLCHHILQWDRSVENTDNADLYIGCGKVVVYWFTSVHFNFFFLLMSEFEISIWKYGYFSTYAVCV